MGRCRWLHCGLWFGSADTHSWDSPVLNVPVTGTQNMLVNLACLNHVWLAFAGSFLDVWGVGCAGFAGEVVVGVGFGIGWVGD